VVAGAVLLIPSPIVDGDAHDRIPAFFTDGAATTQLRPDENVLIISDANGEEMSWQEAAGFTFRMPEGHIGPLPDRYGADRLFHGLAVHDENPFVPRPGQLARFLDARDVTAIVIDDRARAMYQDVVAEAGFAPAYEGAGVSVWRPT
jgi:hypothetical protein